LIRKIRSWWKAKYVMKYKLWRMRRSPWRDVSHVTKDKGHSLLLKGSENDKGQMTKAS
jgi:hypothetical protein